MCHELFLKRAWREEALYARDNLDKGKTLTRQVEIQSIANQLLIGIQAGIDDLEAIKSRYDEILIERNYTSVKYDALLLEDFPTFVCSGVTQPIYDFAGNQLQDLADLEVV